MSTYGGDGMRVSTTGTTRIVLVIGGYAFKIARGPKGCLCNLFEAWTWAEATPARREMLCPVLACAPNGALLVMPAAKPLTETERHTHDKADTFPDWDYWPGDPEEPFEYKASD